MGIPVVWNNYYTSGSPLLVHFMLSQVQLLIFPLILFEDMDKARASDPSRNFAYLPKIINGGIAGIVGVACVFPVDLVKTRLQNQRAARDGKIYYRGIIDCARQSWNYGGRTIFAKARGMYSGVGVNLLLITPEKAIKLVANDCFRFHLAIPDREQLPLTRGIIAGGGAGFCQVIVTTPMELLKIQMQDAGRTTEQIKPKKLSAIGLTMDLLRKRGIFGLYKGIGPTVARDVSFSVLYFPLFAYLESLAPRSNDKNGETVFYASFCAGLTAAAFSSFTVTPLDVIKTRMQLISRGDGETEYRNIYDAFTKILRYEGPQALFKGAMCRMLVMAPLFGIAQMVYYTGIAEFLLGIPKIPH
uniref:Uncharacterized protein n=1 Tax=Setaria digitata TaxID=48799 RepID=A0A915PHS9_9BILA